MAKRKTIKKSTRFEVFKRDSFTCQYCGRAAPDVVLNVDHINPVANGGDNEVINLITSCEDCNSGKGAKTLDDSAVIQKQREQLEELNQKREQLEMMMAWKQGLMEMKDSEVKIYEDYMASAGNYGLSEYGRREAKKTIKRYGIEAVLEAAEKAADQYFEYGDDDEVTQESFSKALKMVPRICNVMQQEKEDPDIRELFYIRGILRNSDYYMPYRHDRFCIDLLKEARDAGVPVSDLKDAARDFSSWAKFRDWANMMIRNLEE